MDLLTLLTTTVGLAVGKFLLKRYLGAAAGAVGEGLAEIARRKITGIAEQREAARLFEKVGDQIARALLPLFERAVQRGQLNVEAVVHQLAHTLESGFSAKLVVQESLSPAAVVRALLKCKLPPGQFTEAETTLYERALAETVAYLIGIAGSLPRFQEELAAESLRRLDRTGADLELVLKTAQRIEARVCVDKEAARAQQFEAYYRQAVALNLDYLELFGAELTPESRRHKLSVAYVTLTLDAPARKPGPTGVLPAAQVLDSLPAREPRLLIRGDAGSGKSTLLRWLAIEAASYSGDDRVSHADSPVSGTDLRPEPALARPWRGRVPFLIRLRDCPRGELPSPDAFPGLVARQLGTPPAGWVTQTLGDGRGLVLIDGVDEVPVERRDALRSDLQALVETYKSCVFVVTTRPGAVPDNWLRGLGFRSATIDELSPHDRAQLIDKWHQAVAEELRRQGRPADDLPALAAALKEELKANPAIARLATNPLLCAMVCALHRDTQARLPQSQNELCEALCFTLLHRRDELQRLTLGEFAAPYPDLTYKQKRVLVQDLAQYMVLNRESAVSRQQVQKRIAFAMREFFRVKPMQAETILRGLIERSGMLRGAGSDGVEFVHNAFKEFLAAEYFCLHGHLGLLEEHSASPDWREVILFAVATNVPEVANRLVRALLRSRARQQQVLAVCCKSRAFRLAPELRSRLEKLQKKLFPPKTAAEARALAWAGDAVVPFLKYRKSFNAAQAAACVRALRLIETEAALAVLEDYRADGRPEVMAELVQVYNTQVAPPK